MLAISKLKILKICTILLMNQEIDAWHLIENPNSIFRTAPLVPTTPGYRTVYRDRKISCF